MSRSFGSPAKFGDPVVGLLAIRSGQVGALEGSLTDSPLLSGRELWQWDTNELGDPMLVESETTRAPHASTGWRHLYTGRPWDAQTRSYYYRHRWYDPHQARFLSRDALGYADGLLQYAYVGGDPMNYMDPSGLSSYRRPQPHHGSPGQVGPNGDWNNNFWHPPGAPTTKSPPPRCVKVDDPRRRLPFTEAPGAAEYNIVLLKEDDPTFPCLDGVNDYYPKNDFQFFNLLKDMSGAIAEGSEIAIHAHGGQPGTFSGTGMGTIILDKEFEEERYDFCRVEISFRVCGIGKGLTATQLRNLWEAMGGNGRGNRITVYTSPYYVLPFGVEIGGVWETYSDEDFPTPTSGTNRWSAE